MVEGERPSLAAISLIVRPRCQSVRGLSRVHPDPLPRRQLVGSAPLLDRRGGPAVALADLPVRQALGDQPGQLLLWWPGRGLCGAAAPQPVLSAPPDDRPVGHPVPLADVLVRQALRDQAGQLLLWWPPAPGPLRCQPLGPTPPGDRRRKHPVT